MTIATAIKPLIYLPQWKDPVSVPAFLSLAFLASLGNNCLKR